MKNKAQLKSSDLLLASFLILLSIYAIIAGLQMGFWTNDRPGTGFMPVISAGIMLLSSLVLIFTKLFGTPKTGNGSQATIGMAAENTEKHEVFENEEEGNPRRDDETKFGRVFLKILPNAKIRWAIIMTVYVFATISIIDSMGMIFGLGLFVFTFVKFIGKYSWLKSIVITLVMVMVIYLIFSVLLKISLPRFMNAF